MEKQRIQVYADVGTKRRIELAAAKYDIPVTEYCMAAIQRQLADDDLLEQAEIVIPVKVGQQDAALIADLRALHREIELYRGGQQIDIDHDLSQMRDERDHELTAGR